MKWLLRGLAAIATIAVAYGVIAIYVPAARIAKLYVPAVVTGINLGMIPLDRADWGYLKLRSGQTGLDALRDLERHGATDKIRQMAAAVDMQWLEAGHVTEGGHLFGRTVQEEETRFDELSMPLDGKTLRQDLTPGQAIPESFWQDHRYRLWCFLPTRGIETAECRLSMADLNGDDRPEIILDRLTIGHEDLLIKPVIVHSLTAYIEDKSEWKLAFIKRLCDVERASVSDANFKISAQTPDMLWINGHAVNFFDHDCSGENAVPAPTSGLRQAQAMAPSLSQVELLPSSKPMPASLMTALVNRSLVLSSTGPQWRDSVVPPRFQGLPPCFIKRTPKSCTAMVADLDRDGSDDVVILDQEVREDMSIWRLATLLMVREGRWTVVANHAACAEKGQTIESLKIELKPSEWKPISFAGRLYLPDEPSDTCKDHYPSL